MTLLRLNALPLRKGKVHTSLSSMGLLGKRFYSSETPSSVFMMSGTKKEKLKQVNEQLSKYKEQLRSIRKEHYEKHKASLQLSPEQEAALKEEKRKKEEMAQTDPMVVGTLHSRRALKKELVSQFGKLERTPLTTMQPSRFESVPPPIKYQPLDEEHELSVCFERDLTPSNPRLAHLLHLWHQTEHFVTKTNLDEKIQQFCQTKMAIEFDEPMEAKFKELETFQIQPAPSPPRFDPNTFATDDVEFQIPQEYLPVLEEGSRMAHEAMRENILKDKITGSLYGKPGVSKILEWGRADPSELQKASPQIFTPSLSMASNVAPSSPPTS